jgi:hypothetical protein
LIFLSVSAGVLHEHPRIGSDGESEEVSLASDPDVTSPVKMRQKNRRLSEVCFFFFFFFFVIILILFLFIFVYFLFGLEQQDISKRLSLPADLRIPESFLAKQSSSSPIFDGPLTRTNRRQSLSEIGFGRMETYTKLDKLGEVSSFSFLNQEKNLLDFSDGMHFWGKV